MTSRKRFCIPSESDIKESTNDQDKQFSKFKSFKLNKDPDEKSVDIPCTSTSLSTSDVSSIPTAKRLGTSSNAQQTKSDTTSKSSSAPNYPKSNTLSTSRSASDTKSDMPSSLSSVPNQSAQIIQSTSKPASSNSIIVNFRQRGNPVLKHIRNVPWEYGSIIPDYVMGVANCALYLSLRYHQLHPDYLHNRLKELGKGYDLRVLLVQVDVKEPHTLLKDLAKICILADMTLVLAFSQEEVGRYLEAYKVFENKPEEALMEKSDTDFGSKLTECLTTVKSVNKTDCMTLLTAFKSMNGIINASKQDIGCCGGFGPQKAQRLYDVFHEPFVQSRKSLK